VTEGNSFFSDISRIPTFHPIHRREKSVWYPGNDAADFLLQIRNVWEDILMLRGMIDRSSDQTERKLLFKYILVELYSILEPIKLLQDVIFTAPVRKPGEPVPWRSISEEEKETAKRLFRQHNVAKNNVESLVSEIRNKIGAHRDQLVWQRVMELWDSLEPQRFHDLLNTIPPIFGFAKELDLYEWTRQPDDSGAIEIFLSLKQPWVPVDPKSEEDNS
jgi:hypothetical protein